MGLSCRVRLSVAKFVSSNRCVKKLCHVQVWKCEFCYHDNEVDIVSEEQPKQNDVTFMLVPALCTAASGAKASDQSLVVFCMDTSGSMCLTSEVRYCVFGLSLAL